MFKDKECWQQKRLKPSPTSQSCRQHISSATYATNIDVATFEHQLFPDEELELLFNFLTYNLKRYTHPDWFDAIFNETANRNSDAVIQ